MGHACRAALHGNLSESVQHHPLGLPGMLFLGLAYLFLSIDLTRGTHHTLRFFTRPWPRWAQASVLGLIGLAWAWKLFLK